MSEKRYVVEDYYIWDNKERTQVLTFDRVSSINAESVCELLNEHEAMKGFFINVANALKEENKND